MFQLRLERRTQALQFSTPDIVCQPRHAACELCQGRSSICALRLRSPLLLTLFAVGAGLGVLPAKQALVPPGHRVFEMMLVNQQQRRHGPVAELKDDRPLIVIAGCGLSGVALALALQHRGMRAVIYEKDANFDSRSQGYGLTIQQARCISPCRAFDSHILTFCAGCDSAQAACHRRYGG